MEQFEHRALNKGCGAALFLSESNSFMKANIVMPDYLWLCCHFRLILRWFLVNCRVVSEHKLQCNPVSAPNFDRAFKVTSLHAR